MNENRRLSLNIDYVLIPISRLSITPTVNIKTN